MRSDSQNCDSEHWGCCGPLIKKQNETLERFLDSDILLIIFKQKELINVMGFDLFLNSNMSFALLSFEEPNYISFIPTTFITKQ